MSDQKVPGVVFQPRAQQELQRGINQLVNVVRPTLGPCPRVVAVENTFRNKTPELLDDAGVITRRIIQLPERAADMGAMLLRHILWRVHEDAGDGTATAAVLFQGIYNRGVHYLASGGNAMPLRRALERGLQIILEELDRSTIPISGKEALAQLAESLCFDEELARYVGEVFDIVGEEGLVDIRSGHSRSVERHYVEGMHWPSAVLSPHLFTDQTKLRSDMTDAAILISDLEIDDPRQLVPLIDIAFNNDMRSLLLIANKLSEQAIALLISANREPERFRIIAVRTPGAGVIEQAAAMEDLAVLTGGRPLLAAAGDTLRGLTVEHFGRARRVWGDGSYMGVIGGKGDPRTLRRHLATLRAALKGHADDSKIAAPLQKRIGKLLGGSATLLVGGSTEPEIKAREELARKTANLVRGALREGVLPGGGVALLACRARLRSMIDSSASLDEQVAYRILIRALEEPLRAIATNAGYDAAAVIGQVERAEAGHGFDALSGEVVDMAQAGIYDVAAVLKAALRGAVAGAATALTVDTLVHTKKPESVAGRP